MIFFPSILSLALVKQARKRLKTSNGNFSQVSCLYLHSCRLILKLYVCTSLEVGYQMYIYLDKMMVLPIFDWSLMYVSIMLTFYYSFTYSLLFLEFFLLLAFLLLMILCGNKCFYVGYFTC